MFWRKYQSLGNDFLIAPLIDYEKRMGSMQSKISPAYVEPIVRLCDRKKGFGADGVILHHELKNGKVECFLINSDGSFATFSGNGFACLASYFNTERHLLINGIFYTSKLGDYIELNLEQFSSIKDRYLFEHRLADYDYSLWNVGNEHAIFSKFTDKPNELLYNNPFISFDKLEEGKLESHFKSPELYPDGINVGLAFIGKNWIQLKVWERGCGWTEACSSAAIAAFLAANTVEQMTGEIEIMQSGGVSAISWIEPNKCIGLRLKPSFVGSLEYEIKR